MASLRSRHGWRSACELRRARVLAARRRLWRRRGLQTLVQEFLLALSGRLHALALRQRQSERLSRLHGNRLAILTCPSVSIVIDSLQSDFRPRASNNFARLS